MADRRPSTKEELKLRKKKEAQRVNVVDNSPASQFIYNNLPIHCALLHDKHPRNAPTDRNIRRNVFLAFSQSIKHSL